MRRRMCRRVCPMTNDSDSMCSNQSWPIEDDDLRDILQLADIIRANPIYDDTVAVFDSDLMSFFDTQLSAPADPAAGNNSLLYRIVIRHRGRCSVWQDNGYGKTAYYLFKLSGSCAGSYSLQCSRAVRCRLYSIMGAINNHGNHVDI